MGLKVLIVGLGSIGLRHLANLRQLQTDAHITVCRTHSQSRNIPPEADSVVFNLDCALASKPTAAIVATPSAFHIATALDLAQEGTHLFIEKPLSHNLDGVDELLELCRRRHLVLFVGYVLRFQRSLQLLRSALQEGKIGRILSLRAEAGQFLPEWRPGSDYRKGVSGRRDLGGGAVLELSHELDYVPWLVGDVQSVSAQIGQLGDLEIDVEDMAEIVLRFRNGAIGSVHLDMLQRPATRTCRIVGTDGTVVWDGLSHRVHGSTQGRGPGWI
jgi:predicted dehydrogenase